jgi:uncharacterized protein YegP (UPF0339 family)
MSVKVIIHKKREPRIEYIDDVSANPKQRYRWRIWASSDIIAASSEGYESLNAAKENIKDIGKYIQALIDNGKLV